MKKILPLLIVFSLSGCYNSRISELETQVSKLQGRISNLEKLQVKPPRMKSWLQLEREARQGRSMRQKREDSLFRNIECYQYGTDKKITRQMFENNTFVTNSIGSIYDSWESFLNDRRIGIDPRIPEENLKKIHRQTLISEGIIEQ